MASFAVIPETPEARTSYRTRKSETVGRRRSVRLESKRENSLGSNFSRIPETPGETESPLRRRTMRRLVEESPVGNDTKEELSDSTPPPRVRHPVFPKAKTSDLDLESEDTFVQFVAATQELASTHIEVKDKVDSWMNKNDQEQKRRSVRRKVTTNDLAEILIGKEEQVKSNSTRKADSPFSKQSRRRRTSIIFKDSPQFRRQLSDSSAVSKAKSQDSKTDSDQEKSVIEEESKSKFEVPDFSSDSAKALMEEFEKKLKTSEETQNKENDMEVEETEMEVEENEIQLDKILDGVVAYVEFRSGHENRSKCVQDVLKTLGAVVSEKLNSRVTHMVFKDGGLATYTKAKKLGIHIVSVTWIEECKKKQKKVDEKLFPSISKEKYESPGLFPKLRKAKSMQPKSDEELQRKIEQQIKRRERKHNHSLSKMTPEMSKTGLKRTAIKYPVPLDYYESPSSKKNASNNDSILNLLNELETCNGTPTSSTGKPKLVMSPKSRLNSSQSSTMSSPCSEDLNTPLGRRLVNKYYRGTPSSPVSRKSMSEARKLIMSPLAKRDEKKNDDDNLDNETHKNDISGIAVLNTPDSSIQTTPKGDRQPRGRPKKRSLSIDKPEVTSTPVGFAPRARKRRRI